MSVSFVALFICTVYYVLSVGAATPPPDACKDACCEEHKDHIDDVFDESEHWDDEDAVEYLKHFHRTALGKCIKNMKPGSGELRPNVTCYLPPKAIECHLAPYIEGGASAIVPTYYANKANFGAIGYGSGQWVSPLDTDLALLKRCTAQHQGAAGANAPNGAIANCVLARIGVPQNKYDMFQRNRHNGITRVMLVYAFPNAMQKLNVRIPNGNENGANALWIPGGYTSQGVSEAIVNIIHTGEFCWTAVSDVAGRFCYPHCNFVCNQTVSPGCAPSNCVSRIRSEHNAWVLGFPSIFMISLLSISALVLVCWFGRRCRAGASGKHMQFLRDIGLNKNQNEKFNLLTNSNYQRSSGYNMDI